MGVIWEYVQPRCGENQGRMASRRQCDGFVPKRGRYLTPGCSASDAPPSVHQRLGTHKVFYAEGTQ